MFPVANSLLPLSRPQYPCPAPMHNRKGKPDESLGSASLITIGFLFWLQKSRWRRLTFGDLPAFVLSNRGMFLFKLLVPSMDNLSYRYELFKEFEEMA